MEQPFPMWIRYELEDASEGIRARIRARGDASGFFRLATPFLSRMVHRNITNDPEMLREYLEAQEEPTQG